MTQENRHGWFDDLDAVIAEPLKFKVKLGIGEDAYTSLKMKKRLSKIWDVVGAATTGAWAANTTVVAATFFPTTGVLAWVGIGAAATPVGWVAAAAVMSAGTWYGVTQIMEKQSRDKTTTIPTFINTPIDVLALMLFDLMAPLALKVAIIDGHVHELEREYIKRYFVDEWGYDKDFINKGIAFTESKVPEFSIKDLAENLAELQKENRDCKFESMAYELNLFLSNVMEADGKIDECEEMAIERVNQIFHETGKWKFSDIFSFPSFGKDHEENSSAQENICDEDDLLDQRLSNATPVELVKMRKLLGLDVSADMSEIVSEYRMVAGNILANFARRFGALDSLAYKEILVAILESLRPVGEDIQIYMNKIKGIFTLRKRETALGDIREEQTIIKGLEQALLDKVKELEAGSAKQPRFGKDVVKATIEIIMIGRRQAAELESI